MTEMRTPLPKPWERPPEAFRHPHLLTWVRARRAELVWAGLTLVRGWLAAGRPSGRAMLGSFEGWASALSGMLDLAGIPGLLENKTALFDRVSTREAAMRALLAEWWASYRGLARAVKALSRLHADAVEALGLGGETVEARNSRLGIYLTSCEDKMYPGIVPDAVPSVDVQLIRAKVSGGVASWELRRVERHGVLGGVGGVGGVYSALYANA